MHHAPLKARARRYYEKINAGEFDDEYFGLFADDVEIFYPKFGFAYGHDAVKDFGNRVQSIVSEFAFDLDRFIYTCQDNRVVVEITEYGRLRNGKRFPDGKVSFGKFCCVFEFNKDGLIQRYHSYGDPDYAAEDPVRLAIFARHKPDTEQA